MEECEFLEVVSFTDKLRMAENAKVVCSNGETSAGADLYRSLRASGY
jgi:hypothetical protein